MTAMRLHRYPSPSGGIALGKMGVGAKMMWQSQLPPGARWVEYLESTGTQWIDTGLLGRDGYDFEYRFRLLNPLPCGIGGEYEDYRSCYIGLVRTNGYFAYHYYDSQKAIVQVQQMTLGADYNIKAHLYSGEQYFDINGVRGGIGSITGSFVSNFNIHVFAINSYNQAAILSNMRLYSLKIYLNGVLVRDFIPVRVGTTGAMYDRLGTGGMNPDGSARTDGFYFNRGTGAFIIGPDTNAPAT